MFILDVLDVANLRPQLGFEQAQVEVTLGNCCRANDLAVDAAKLAVSRRRKVDSDAQTAAAARANDVNEFRDTGSKRIARTRAVRADRTRRGDASKGNGIRIAHAE